MGASWEEEVDLGAIAENVSGTLRWTHTLVSREGERLTFAHGGVLDLSFEMKGGSKGRPPVALSGVWDLEGESAWSAEEGFLSTTLTFSPREAVSMEGISARLSLLVSFTRLPYLEEITTLPQTGADRVSPGGRPK